MVYKYLGYGVTDSNGVAKLDHDAEGQELQHSYTGVGAGEVDVVASLDNPVSQGSIVSVPCSVWDYLFYDDGITSPKTANWTNYQDRITVSVDETGTTLLRDASSSTGYYLTPSAYATPFIMEFEMVAISNKNTCGIDFAVSGSDNNKTFNNLVINAGDTIYLTYDGETIRTYRNGSTTPNELALSVSGNIDIGFYIAPNESIKFKNLKIYKG